MMNTGVSSPMGVVGTSLLLSLAFAGCQVPSGAPVPGGGDLADAGTVLITGSNRGIGLEFARQYAASGWDVIATARNPEGADDLRSLAAAYPAVTIEQLDVTDATGIDALAEKYRGQPIDLLINNAGVLGDLDRQNLQTLDYEEFELVMAVNVFGPLLVSRAFLEHVAASEHRKIAVVSSTAGSIELSGGYPGPFFYNISKAGVNMGMRTFASATRGRGIRVALIHPGGVNTRMLEQAGRAGAGIEPRESVSGMIEVIERLNDDTSGTFRDYRGRSLPW